MAQLHSKNAGNGREDGNGEELTPLEYERLRSIFEPCAKCFDRHLDIMDCLEFKYVKGEEYEQEEISKLCDNCRNKVVLFPPSVEKSLRKGVDRTTGKPRSAAKQLAHLRDIGCVSIEQMIQSIAYFESGGLRADVWGELSQGDQVKFINTTFPPGSFNRV